jgi:DNA-binding CsgD family transcriptional regulator
VRGREQELRIAGEILRGAQRGRGGVFLIEGEQGTGKSELLTEVTKLAVSENFSVAAAGAGDLGGLMPFSPLLAALEPVKPLRPLKPLNEVPDGLARPGAPDGQVSAIDEIATLLKRRAAQSPLLISLDDMQWADRATLLALRLLPPQLASCRVVWSLARGTRRGGAGVLFDFLQAGGAARVTLAPLDGDAVTGLIAEVAGAAPDPGLAGLAAGAAGNPFLLVELLRGLREENAIRVSDQTAILTSERLPQRVHAVARRRLDGLSAPARHLVETAAVLGLSFRLEDVARMLGETPAVLLPLVNQAVETGILSASAEAFVFRHELIWRAVTEALPQPARQALHRQFGEMLLARGGSAMAAASHLLKGTRQADSAAVAGLDTAADEILPSAPQTAADLAVRALELTPPADPARLCRTARAAEMLTAAARLDEASSIVRATLAEPQPPASDSRLRGVLSSILCLQGQAAQASAEAETVLGRPRVTGSLRDEALIAQLHALIALGENQRARDVAENVLAGFGEHGKPALAGALSVLAAICWDEGRLGQGLHLAGEAVRRSGSVSPDARHFQPLLTLAARLVDLRRLEEATEVINAAGNRIRAFRSGASEAIPGILRARVDLAMGRMDDARAAAEAALSIADARGTRTHSSLALSMLSVIALRGGDLRAAGLHVRNRPDITHSAECYARTETMLARAQFVEAAAGPETAMQLLGDIYAGLPAHRHVLVGEPTASAWLARTAIAAGRYELATGVARVADEIARDNPAVEVVTAAAAHCGGLVGRDPARLARAAAGHHDPWARASAAEDLGNVLAGTRSQQDAVAHLDNALEGYGQTGAARDLARVRRRLRRLGVRRRYWASADRPAEGWASLTETEVVTSRLVARGLSNPQVAGRMYVSAHTVAFHLRQVFRKLGISSRVELARLVAEQPEGQDSDLTPPDGMDLGPGLWRDRQPEPGRQPPPRRAQEPDHNRLWGRRERG